MNGARDRRDQQIRREGMADAAVVLVARRVAGRSMDLRDWAAHLGLTDQEVRGAVDRFRNQTRPEVKAKRSNGSQVRQQIVQWLHAHDGEVTSDTGQGLTPKIAADVGISEQSCAHQLLHLERDGLVVRTINGRRCYRIALADQAEDVA